MHRIYMKKYLLINFVLFISVVCSSNLKLGGDSFDTGWTQSNPTEKYFQNDLYGHINGGAELFLEFGFDSLFVKDYSHDSLELSLEVYCMDSPEAALGIYLMKCGKEKAIAQVQTRNTGSVYQILAVKNRYYIQCNNFKGNEKIKPDMFDLVNNLLKTIPPDQYIILFNLLPEKNRIAGSELIVRGPYALQPIYTFGEGDIFLLKGEIFGVVADYETAEKQKSSLLQITYPDEKMAINALNHLTANLDSYIKILKDEDNTLVFKDYKNQFGKATPN